MQTCSCFPHISPMKSIHNHLLKHLMAQRLNLNRNNQPAPLLYLVKSTFYSERLITSNWTIVCQVCIMSDRRLLDILGNDCRLFCAMIPSPKDMFGFCLLKLKTKVPHKQVQRVAAFWGVLQDLFTGPQTAPVNHSA